MKKIVVTVLCVFWTIQSFAQNDELPVSIYPNPFADSLTYEITTAYGDSVGLEVFDLRGRLLLGFEKQPYYFSQNFLLTFESLDDGVYVASISLDSTTHDHKVLKRGGSRSVSLKLEITVEPPINDELAISPNPTNSGLDVRVRSSSPQIHMSLYDLEGKMLLEKVVENETGTIDWKLDLSEFPDGIYIIRTNSKDWEWSQRVLKN